MKILQIMAGARFGGAETAFECMLPALAKTSIEQVAAIRTHEARHRHLVNAGIPVHQMRFGGPLDLLTPWRLARIADEFAPDIALSWMSRAARMLPRGPWCNVGRLDGYYNLRRYRRCDCLVTVTEDIRRYAIDGGWPSAKVHMVPNFVVERTMPPLSRAELDTPEEVPLLLCAGRLHRNKGFDIALRALAEIPDAFLWISGEGPEDAALRDLAQRLGVIDRVRFAGWREDVPALMAAADVFVCSSRHEPFGLIVLEAWVNRIPMVAASAQGPAMLVEDGKTGLLSPIDDADILVRNITRLLHDKALCHDLTAAGYAVFRERYCEAKVVAAYQDFLHGLLPA